MDDIPVLARFSNVLLPKIFCIVGSEYDAEGAPTTESIGITVYLNAFVNVRSDKHAPAIHGPLPSSMEQPSLDVYLLLTPCDRAPPLAGTPTSFGSKTVVGSRRWVETEQL